MTDKKPTDYDAKLIDRGVIKGTSRFKARDELDAFTEAHDGVDVLKGQWVEVKPVTKKKNVRLQD
jgi:hypothetical protein